MANPVPDIIEALGARLDGWQPEDGREASEFVASLPDLVQKLLDVLKGTFEDMDDKGVLRDRSREASQEALAALLGAAGELEAMNTAFQEENSFWLSS